MATLGSLAPGAIVKLNENSTPVNYVVVNQGIPQNSSLYDSSCDGTWVLRQDLAENRVWDDGNVNKLESSDIHSYLNNTWINRYDTDIRNAIKQVKIPYRQNGGSGGTDRTGANGLSCKIFLLSGYEVGWTTSDNSYFPVDGAKLAYFTSGTSTSANNKRIAYLNGSATFWWLRSPYTSNTNGVWGVISNGDYRNWNASSSCGVRPALVLPSTLLVSDDGSISVAPEFDELPIQIMQGQNLPISWSSIDGATSYNLQRSADSSTWTTIYSGATTSYTDTIGDWSTVQYQVQAVYDTTEGGYGQSSVIQVISASVLTISGEDGNLGTLTNDINYTVSTDTGNTISLTRTVNGVKVATLTVNSGFAYTIPVIDLPTGSGTIVITATVATSTSPVTATRTWQYTKADTTFANSGGVAQLTQNAINVWPETLADTIQVPTIWGGSLDKALELMYPIVQTAVISVGTYVGTGTYGESSPNTLTFTDSPSVVIIYGDDMEFVISSTDTTSQAYIDGNTAKWYSTVSAEAQMNSSGVTYTYTAIGKNPDV